MAQPLTPTELRALIYVRLGVASQASRQHRNIVVGQVEALLFALTGEHRSLQHLSDSRAILDFAGIPYIVHKVHEGNMLETSDEWMKEHGFDPDPKGGYGDHHPRFSEKW